MHRKFLTGSRTLTIWEESNCEGDMISIVNCLNQAKPYNKMAANKQVGNRSFLFGEVVEYIGFGLELARIHSYLAGLLDQNSVLQDFDALFEVFSIVLVRCRRSAVVAQGLYLFISFVLGEEVFASVQYCLIEDHFVLKELSVGFVHVYSGVEDGQHVHEDDRLKIKLIFMLQDRFDQNPEFFVLPFCFPRKHLLSALKDLLVLSVQVPNEYGVKGCQPKQQICEVVQPAEVSTGYFSLLLNITVNDQLQLFIRLETVPSLVGKLEQFEQFAKDNQPYLLQSHQAIDVEDEDVAIDRVLFNLAAF